MSINGILVVNKEKGLTSRAVVNQVSKILNTKKVGHTGTLDPMATGVMVLCVGTSLKLVELLMNHDKEYIATVKLGIETDTLDITGQILKREIVPEITKNDIKKALKNFCGKIKQEVPRYSAIKVNGRKLYEYARAGIDVPLPIHEIEVSKMELLGDIVDNSFQIRCSVSKGTYIRSLVRDIGYALGTVAVMSDLQRTRVGDFLLENSYTVAEIERGKYQLLTPQEVLKIPCVIVDKILEAKISNGCVLDPFFSEDMVMILNSSHKLLAIYCKSGEGKVKPYRMFLENS